MCKKTHKRCEAGNPGACGLAAVNRSSFIQVHLKMVEVRGPSTTGMSWRFRVYAARLPRRAAATVRWILWRNPRYGHVVGRSCGARAAMATAFGRKLCCDLIHTHFGELVQVSQLFSRLELETELNRRAS